MFTDSAVLIFSALLILLCAELFTNSIEWVGHILKLSEGTIGSVFAAIGTALPETLVPMIAVICFGKSHGNEVSIGAIAGAPFMLCTLTFAVCGISVWLSASRGRRSPKLNMDPALVSRDLGFFIGTYSIGMASALAPGLSSIRGFIAIGLVLIYPFYLYLTFSDKGEISQEPERLHFAKPGNHKSDHIGLVTLQVILGLSGILAGAYFFVDHLQSLALGLGVSPLLLSLVLTPIATNLPENTNSILWARRGKDTLALCNISGALVFQCCFSVAFGVGCTPWNLDPQTLATVIISISVAAVYLFLLKRGSLKSTHLMCGAIIYLITIAAVIFTHG